jgi:hypothetical protein
MSSLFISYCFPSIAVYIFAFFLLISYPLILHYFDKTLKVVKKNELPIGTVIFLMTSIIYIMIYGQITYAYQLLDKNITYIESLYWANSTFTTLGYGDYLPKSDDGKFLSMALSLTGIMHMVSFMAIILNKLNSHKDKDENP